MAEKRSFGRRGPNKKDGKGPRGPRRGESDKWRPVTKLGRLVESSKVSDINEIFRFSLPIKESAIVDHFLGEKIKEEVMVIKPVQKQTQAGQRTRFKAYVIIGDEDGHVGLGSKLAKEVQGAIKGAISDAKLNLIPVRKGYWGNKIGAAHTVPCKVTGKGGSVRVRLVPAPRGTGIVGAPTSKKVLQLAGIQDCYTQTTGSTKTRGNFLLAVYHALEHTYKFLTPDFWGKPAQIDHPYEQYSKFLHTGKD